MGFSQLIKHNKIVLSDILFIGHVIVGDFDVGFFHLSPMGQVGKWGIDDSEEFGNVGVEIGTGGVGE